MNTETDRKEDKAMTTANDARKAHKILDDLFKRKPVLDEEREFLRRALPELPKQKTLKEILVDVESAARGVTDNYWSPSTNPQDWLWELHAQLKGLKDTPATVTALPTGMRLADHEELGRVAVSPKPQNGDYMIFAIVSGDKTGADWFFATDDQLTFLDADSGAEPTHPEFLETEADYQIAPEGTIIALDDAVTVWLKKFGGWRNTAGDHGVQCIGLADGRRRVLRWGWGK